jgi:hypothetical protein
MAQFIENPCRIALVDALALLDGQGQHGAACYVAMAIDCLDEAEQDGKARPLPLSPQPGGLAAGGPA